MHTCGNNKRYKLTQVSKLSMALLASERNDTMLEFRGASHRLFIEGRGFDFKSLSVNPLGNAKLILLDSDDNLYTFLDFEEPRVMYVVSRVGVKDLILQGCVIEEIRGNNCILSYSKLQSES